MSGTTAAETKPERNIEIKARIQSDEDFEKKVKIAKNLTSNDGELIEQHDVFFGSQQGRLKLRYLKNTKSQLVYYDRPDIAGPKLSKFNKIEVDEPKLLETILTASNGVLGVVKKQRFLFLHKNIRIHLDKVENLGNFLEFEVCLSTEQTIDEGTLQAEEMMKIFEIKEEHLMTGAYFDELVKECKHS